MRAQMLKTDAVDGVKKGKKAHRETLASEQNKACILLLLRIIRNFDQNVCPVRGTYYANKRTYMEKNSLYGKILKAPPTPGSENFAQNVGPWGGGLRCIDFICREKLKTTIFENESAGHFVFDKNNFFLRKKICLPR